MTEALGIYQSDIILRSAIISGLADLRANPALLDYVFASLARDEITKHVYGTREAAEAKRWFMSTEIPVFLNVRIDDAKMPCISISLDESVEQENTLGDVHYQPEEDNTETWPPLSCAFTPRSYEPLTGKMVVPKIVGETVVLYPGMVIVDHGGVPHTILDVDDFQTMYLDKNLAVDFTDSVIKGKHPSQVNSIESAGFKETFTLGCHVQGEAAHLTYLHSLVVYCLLAYRETLMEARGFERTQFASSDFMRNENFGAELVFSRFIKLTAFVRQYWPKTFRPKVTSMTVQPLVIRDAGKLPQDTKPSEASWIGDDDEIDALTGKPYP